MAQSPNASILVIVFSGLALGKEVQHETQNSSGS
jgi:hypothetical protein